MSEKSKEVKSAEQQAPAAVVTPPAVDKPKPSATLPVFVLLYVMYKTHMLSRIQLKNMLNALNGTYPEDLVGWLVKESSR